MNFNEIFRIDCAANKTRVDCSEWWSPCSASTHDDDDGCVVICRWHALYWVTASVCPLCQQRVALAARERSLSYLSEIPRFQHKSLSPRKLYGSREKWAIGYTYSTLILKKKKPWYFVSISKIVAQREKREIDRTNAYKLKETNFCLNRLLCMDSPVGSRFPFLQACHSFHSDGYATKPLL